MDSIEQLWDRIETWLATHAPEIRNALEEGATEAEIEQAENTIGVTLPPDVKASFLRHRSFGPGDFLMGQSITYGLAEMVRGQQGLKERRAQEKRIPEYLSGPIQPVWWHSLWLPLTGDGAGNLWCLDLAPAPGGQIGQVIDFDHEVGPTKVVATSFRELLATFADQLEKRRYIAQGLNLSSTESIWDELVVLDPPSFIEETFPSLPTISTHTTVLSDDLDSALNRLFGEVRTYMEKQNIQPLGERGLTAFARYEELADDQVVLEVGILVRTVGPETEGMKNGLLPGGTIGTLYLFGFPICIPDAFEELEERAEGMQKMLVGSPWITFHIDSQTAQEVPFIEEHFYFEARRLIKT